jgi:D-alanyl-D-alanine carboxypeptidase
MVRPEGFGRTGPIVMTLRLAAVAIAACALLAVPPASAGKGGTQRALDELVAAETGPVGASALIQRGRKVEFLRAGSADLRTGRAFHRSDHMRIASVAKAFSGAVALSLVDRGALELEDTLGEMLPGSPPQWSQVTLAQLMQHTSGIPSYIENPEFGKAFGEDLRRYFSPEELVGYVADEPLEFPPGSTYEYSNTDNILIGLISEATTGRRYENDLRQLVYRPLGLEQTSLPSDWILPRRFIHGYDIPDEGESPEDLSELISASGAWASGGIVSTPLELNRFIRGYGGGELFDTATRRRQFDFVPGCGEPPGPGECSAGLSIYRYRMECGTVFGHSGNFPGYTQFAATSKDGRRSVVVTVNQAHAGEPTSVSQRVLETYELAACFALSGRG